MPLTKDQRNEIRDVCLNYMTSLGNVSKRKHAETRIDELISSFTCSEQLDLFAQNWNWDGGHERLKQALENPLCEYATALRVYWLGAPQYYLRYSDRTEVSDYELDAWDFLRWIEERYIDSKFVDGEIHYSPPTRSHEVDGRVLPEIMYNEVGKRRSFWQWLIGN